MAVIGKDATVDRRVWLSVPSSVRFRLRLVARQAHDDAADDAHGEGASYGPAPCGDTDFAALQGPGEKTDAQADLGEAFFADPFPIFASSYGILFPLNNRKRICCIAMARRAHPPKDAKRGRKFSSGPFVYRIREALAQLGHMQTLDGALQSGFRSGMVHIIGLAGQALFGALLGGLLRPVRPIPPARSGPCCSHRQSRRR